LQLCFLYPFGCPPVENFVDLLHYTVRAVSIPSTIFNFYEVKPMLHKKRKRNISVKLWISEAEQNIIHERMAELGTENMSAFIRKMALNGYILNVDLSPVKELVSLQRYCANNMNQIAKNINTYGGIYPQEIIALQEDYAALWLPLSEILEQLVKITKM